MPSRAVTRAIGGLAIIAMSIVLGLGLARRSERAHGDSGATRLLVSEAIVELATAARLAPDVARYSVVRALALDASGRRDHADAVLLGVIERHPFDREALSLLVRYRLERHDSAGALTYARRLAASQPGNAEMQRLVQHLSVRGNH
jgi:Flp pilus assembly protein TadD